eukprot:gene9158-10106_t
MSNHRYSPMQVSSGVRYPIDPSIQKYPYCIVWTPLPVISWFLPFIGHTGIADSEGCIYDFAGPYTIGVGKLTFSSPAKYLQLDPAKCTLKDWNTGVQGGCDMYRGRMHNIFCDNCHSHVAKCLNIMGYDKRTNFEMVRIGVWMFFSSSFVDFNGVIKTYLPFTIILFAILLAARVFF